MYRWRRQARRSVPAGAIGRPGKSQNPESSVRVPWRATRCPLGEDGNVLVADGVMFSQLDEGLVDRLGNHVVLVAVRAKQAAGVGLDPGPAGSSADGEVAQPQLGKGETGKIPAVRKTESRVRAAHDRRPGKATANRGQGA